MTDTNRGRIPVPNLDDRMWANIVAEAKALIPSYAPQWTDYNPSDLGITLIELFAWMVEGLTYRLNLVPDKNYIAFLNLLGITRDPATPAQAFLTFTAQQGGPVLGAEGPAGADPGNRDPGPGRFRDGFGSHRAAGEHDGRGADRQRSPLRRLRVLHRPSRAGAGGNHPGRSVGTASLRFRPAAAAARPAPGPAVRSGARAGGASPLAHVNWVYSTAGTQPGAWPVIPTATVTDGTNGLQHDGMVTITPPGDWASQAPTGWTVPPRSLPGRSRAHISGSAPGSTT